MKLNLFICAFFISFSAQAEIAHTLYNLIKNTALRSTHTIIDGAHPDPKNELVKNTVMLSTPKPQSEQGGKQESELCTGTIIEGCVLTAAHCVLENQTTSIYQGIKPSSYEDLIGKSGKVITRGQGGSVDDIAIIKPEGPMSVSGFTREILASSPLKPGKADLVGYGLVGTREVEDSSDPLAAPKKENYGSGRKRVGVGWVQGYGNLDEQRVSLNQQITQGDVIVSSRTDPQGHIMNAVGPGDSGGPLFIDGKLYGTAIASSARSPFLLDNYIAPRNNNFTNKTAHTSMERQREWITETLDKLGCKASTAGERLAEASQKIYGFNGIFDHSSFNRLPENDLNLIKSNIKEALSLDPHVEIRILPKINPLDLDRLGYQVVFSDQTRLDVSVNAQGDFQIE